MNEEPLQDTAFELCRDHRRRLVLSLLMEDERTMTLNDLTKSVAVREHGERITDLSSETVVGTYYHLYHLHVPKLADANVITYDRERNLVEIGDSFAALKPHLSRIIDGSHTTPVVSSD